MRTPIKKRPYKQEGLENLPVKIGSDIVRGGKELARQGKAAMENLKSKAQKVKKFMNQ